MIGHPFCVLVRSIQKLQSSGYLPMLNVRLNKVIKCFVIITFPICNTSINILSVERFHMTSRQPFWCSKTKNRGHVGVPK